MSITFGYVFLALFTVFVLYYTWSILGRSKTGRKRGKAAIQSIEVPDPLCPGAFVWVRSNTINGQDWCDPKLKAIPAEKRPLCPPYTKSGPGPGTGNDRTLYDMFWNAVRTASPGMPLYGFRRVLSSKAVGVSFY